MKHSLSIAIALFGLIALLSWSGCGNVYKDSGATAGCQGDQDCGAQKCFQGVCVDCRSDGDCGANKCGMCQNRQCVTRGGGCCSVDTDCAQSQRCWNVPGKRYGKCGSK